jgi:hypothetical protein
MTMPRPIDADALKDVIQQHDYPLADRLNSIDTGMFTLGIFQAIDEQPTLSPDDVRPVPKWISVEDELPEESGYTIVYCADGDRRHVTFAKYQKTQKRWDLTGARSYWSVLKWMPLPAPPKEVE